MSTKLTHTGTCNMCGRPMQTPAADGVREVIAAWSQSTWSFRLHKLVTWLTLAVVGPAILLAYPLLEPGTNPTMLLGAVIYVLYGFLGLGGGVVIAFAPAYLIGPALQRRARHWSAVTTVLASVATAATGIGIGYGYLRALTAGARLLSGWVGQ